VESYPSGRVLSIAEPAAASLDLLARRACRSRPTPTRKPGALEQQRIFAEEGVDLTRVIIGHCGDAHDFDYLRRLMDAGSYIGCDRFGLYLPGRLDLEGRVELVAHLCELGYAGQIVLSSDKTLWTDWWGTGHGLHIDEWHHTHIVDDVLPAMRKRGEGSFFFSNNSSSLRGRKRMTGQSLYYPRVMMRTLAQVLTEEYSEHGVHVANVVIDGTIDSPGTRALPKIRQNADLAMNPVKIAEAFYYLHTQDRSVWTHELQLTPFSTKPSY